MLNKWFKNVYSKNIGHFGHFYIIYNMQCFHNNIKGFIHIFHWPTPIVVFFFHVHFWVFLGLLSWKVSSSSDDTTLGCIDPKEHCKRLLLISIVKSCLFIFHTEPCLFFLYIVAIFFGLEAQLAFSEALLFGGGFENRK